MFQKPLIVAVVSVLVGMGAHARAACLDVRQTQPLVFKGSLSRPVFPGPPNYEDVKKGDKPERAYIIKLDAPICATGDEFLDSSQTFDGSALGRRFSQRQPCAQRKLDSTHRQTR
jgi:hypothetical protein